VSPSSFIHEKNGALSFGSPSLRSGRHSDPFPRWREENSGTPLSRSGLCFICYWLHYVSDEKPGDIPSLLVFIVLRTGLCAVARSGAFKAESHMHLVFLFTINPWALGRCVYPESGPAHSRSALPTSMPPFYPQISCRPFGAYFIGFSENNPPVSLRFTGGYHIPPLRGFYMQAREAGEIW
jgi:hypothetical protein